MCWYVVKFSFFLMGVLGFILFPDTSTGHNVMWDFLNNNTLIMNIWNTLLIVILLN